MRHRNSRLGLTARAALFACFLGVALLAAGCCCHHGTSASDSTAGLTALLDRSALDTEQLVVVISDAPATPHARLYAFERTRRGWQQRLEALPAMLGRNGFAAPGEKREGDGKTPSGVFPLESVFGYAPEDPTRMPYRQATENDLWVDDVSAPDYNTWVRKGATSAQSFEVMRLSDHRYRRGVVIGYNRNPIVKGKGSAIFLHVWLKDGVATSGCVALDEADVTRLIEWLDPARRPKILLATQRDLPVILAAPNAGSAP